MKFLPNLAPLPNGPFDSGSLNSVIPGTASGDLVDLSGMSNWAAQGGYGFPKATTTPKVLDTTQSQPNAYDDGNWFNDPFGSILKGIDKLDPSTPDKSGQSMLGKALGVPAFFTSAPRIGTAIVGAIFIAGGIFLLGKGPVISVVKESAKDLAFGR